MQLTARDVLELTQLEGFRAINHDVRKKFLIALTQKHFPPGSRLADIGCAAGDLTMELQAIGYLMTGVEFERVRIERAKRMAARLGLDVHFVSEDLTTWANTEQFDGLIMGEILEHFVEPRLILEQHLALLRPGGKVLITVPNMSSVRARLKLLFFGEFADHNPEHKFYFTRRRFKEHFASLPVEVLEMSTFLMEITLSRNPTLARLERAVLSPLRAIVPWGGSHLIVVLRKTQVND